jgi:hypothetical protein
LGVGRFAAAADAGAAKSGVMAEKSDGRNNPVFKLLQGQAVIAQRRTFWDGPHDFLRPEEERYFRHVFE